MALLPKSPTDWTRSFAFPLFVACILLMLAALWGGFYGGRPWRFWGRPLTLVILPSLGIALGLTCCFGKGLDRVFKKWALFVAGLSAVLGPMLGPVLAAE